MRTRVRRRLALDRRHELEHDQPRLGATGKRTAAVSVGIQPYDSTFAYGSAWATAYSGGEVERIDPARNKVVKRYPLPSAIGVVGAFASIWATGQRRA